MIKNKKKIFLSIIATSSILTLPIVTLSCNFDKKNPNKPKVQLLTDSQIQEIKEKFEFALKPEGKKLNEEGKLYALWDKFTKSKYNTKINTFQIINWDAEFKKNFSFKYHKLNGLGSAHIYEFKLAFDGQTPIIKYTIKCVDRNYQEEANGIVKLQTD
ncbi:hypothetical protein ACWXVM_01510 [Mycoplasma sp. 2261]